MKIALGVAAAWIALMFAAAASQGCLLVEVHEKSEGFHVVVPVPLFLADVALMFVPEEELRVEGPPVEDLPYSTEELAAIAKRAIETLAEADDGELVSVHDGSDTVLISKVGAELHIEVETDSEQVFVRAPLASAISALDAWDGAFIYLPDLLDAVEQAPKGRLVEVHSDAADVKITMW